MVGMIRVGYRISVIGTHGFADNTPFKVSNKYLPPMQL